MATPWAKTYLTMLGLINPDGYDQVVIKRNFESLKQILLELVKALDEGIEASIASGAINAGTDGCYAMTWMGF